MVSMVSVRTVPNFPIIAGTFTSISLDGISKITTKSYLPGV
jgi:hypothetical protein